MKSIEELRKVLKSCTNEAGIEPDKFDTYWTKEVGVSQELIDEFRSIMLYGELDDPDAIEEVSAQDKSEIKAVYSITGTELPISALNQAGIYVVKYNNGASRKIVVK